MNTDIIYQIIMGLAVVAAYMISRRTQKSLKLTGTERLGILAGAFCGAMIAAKLPFVFSDWDGLVSGLAWFRDGKTIICGLAGGYLGVEVAKWVLDVKTRTGDSFAVPVAVSIGIGRMGCFHAGCCFGTPTNLPWAVVFPTAGDTQPRHPTQLYESAFHLIAAGALLFMLRRGMFQGNLVKLYIIVYAAYRFVTEFIRPEARLAGGFTGYQWASLTLILVFAALWYRDRQRVVAEQAIV